MNGRPRTALLFLMQVAGCLSRSAVSTHARGASDTIITASQRSQHQD